MVRILKATAGDYDIIHGMAKIIWPHTYSKILSPEQLDYMFEMMYSREAFTEQTAINNHHFLLAKEETNYLGFASYQVNVVAGHTKIHKIYVMPEAQSKGVGRQMLEAVSNIARANGNTAIVLNVNRYNPAVTFYEKRGFIKAGEEDIEIGQGYLMEDYIMQLTL